MVHMLDKETKALNNGEEGSESIMTSFFRALDLNLTDIMPQWGE